MDFKTFKTGSDDTGRRLDKVILRLLENKNAAQVFKLLRKNLIRVNDRKAKPDYKIEEGDEIQVAEFLIEERKPENEKEISGTADFPFNILFKNENFLVLEKPYDINVQSASKEDESVDKIVSKYFSDSASISFRCGPLHRLDKKTSGILFFSQSLKGAHFFSEKIREHSLKKTYLAVLQGKVPSKVFHWCDYLSQTDETKPGFKTVKAYKSQTDAVSLKKAITHVKPLSYGKISLENVEYDLTLCEIEIETGRHHQIRCQSSFHGFPLFGDEAYGSVKIKNKKKFISRDFYLHAFRMEFSNEILSEAKELGLSEKIECNMLQDFKNFVEKCGFCNII